MEFQKTYPTPKEFTKNVHINLKKYHELYQQSIQQPNEFWEKKAKEFIYWSKTWDVVQSGDFATFNPRWFVNAQLNACYNCVDRHLDTRAEQVAIIWEGNNPHESKTITYQELYDQVTQFAEVLKRLGVQKGHRVGIYLPMIPEAIMAMLACARVGAIHCVIFGGFSAEALSARLQDANCSLLITADEGLRGDKIIPLKKNADLALQTCPQIQQVLVVRRTGNTIPWEDARDHWYHEAIRDVKPQTGNTCVDMDANDPLFILYTSGSTGKPKGIAHNTGGYLLYTAMTHRYVFNYHDADIYWCTADIGWITGHSYLVYGPLANGGTTLLFEGVPHYPNYARYWEIIDKHQVAIFYTAPTVIRALRREGDEWVKKSSRKSLKLLGSVGEPINPAAWEWYYEVVGEHRCPIVNTWWQTETGGILLTQFPGATPLAPGSVGWPFFGILPEVLDEKGMSLAANQTGSLVIQKPWPGLMQSIYGDPQRYIDNYLKPFPGKFLTGDGAYYHAEHTEHDFWITGRNDDVLNVSGHRIGTEEIESALVSHPAVSEAAVVGIPNSLTGEGIYAFVTTALTIENSESLKQELIAQVREKIGPFARPEVIQWAAALPKTRSGKIMRRLLRKIAQNEVDDLGDTSTLADAGVVEQLIQGRN